MWIPHQCKLEHIYLTCTSKLKNTLLLHRLTCFLNRNGFEVAEGEDAKILNPFDVLSFLEEKAVFYKKKDFIYYTQELKLQILAKESRERTFTEEKEKKEIDQESQRNSVH